MNNCEELVRAEGLYRSFSKYGNKTEVIKGIDLCICRNELTAIMGSMRRKPNQKQLKTEN